MANHDPESYSFLRVGLAVPKSRVANCRANAEASISLMKEAEKEAVSVLVFPELNLSSYTCQDLFQQKSLQDEALEALAMVQEASAKFYSGLVFVGLPVSADDQLFNCAAAVSKGRLLGLVPKTYIPNYKEFYERRWFSPAKNSISNEVRILKQNIPFGSDLLFAAENFESLLIGAEICEDLWTPIPPSSYQALAGAQLVVNLSASNELIGKAAYRKQLVLNQSARCLAAYAYVSCGAGESSTDLVFSGHAILAENGVVLAETERFETEGTLRWADIDLERLKQDRIRSNSFSDNKRDNKEELKFRHIPFSLSLASTNSKVQEKLARHIDAHPFVPKSKENLNERCQEIFHIQVSGLAKRLEHLQAALGSCQTVIGISGGLDSTLALLVTVKAMDLLSQSRLQVKAITMPGFGTSRQTKTNADLLMEKLGVSGREIDIRALCFAEMQTLNHKPFAMDIAGLELPEFLQKLEELPEGSQDLVFENIQARMRTNLLMNSGFVIGTGDLSELALGWCTYNADHMSMYNPNASIPKTLVKFLVDWASTQFEDDVAAVLKDIVNTEISPELLPTGKDGKITQKTESAVGPYELNDFFLFNLLRYGFSPQKILYLAGKASFDNEYSEKELRNWLKLFYKRFFTSQYKRSCLPDGPKVGSVSLSPRGDWRMPSDAEFKSWLYWLDKVDEQRHQEKRVEVRAVKSKHPGY